VIINITISNLCIPDICKYDFGPLINPSAIIAIKTSHAKTAVNICWTAIMADFRCGLCKYVISEINTLHKQERIVAIKKKTLHD
jgi:hypothetical protein